MLAGFTWQGHGQHVAVPQRWLWICNCTETFISRESLT